MKHLLFAALAALLLPLAAFATDAGQLVDVVATGHGSTVREATKAALRAAVEQVVGTMVDATTLVENDELIEDEILSYSTGMIESSKVIGEPKKTADGFFSVKVKATVRKGKLKEKLAKSKAVFIPLDGTDLSNQKDYAQDNFADGAKIIGRALAKRVSCLVVDPIPPAGSKSPIRIKASTGEVKIVVRARIDAAKYQAFAAGVIGALKPMAKSEKQGFAKMSNRTGGEKDEFWDNGGCLIPMPITPKDEEREGPERMEDASSRVLYVVEGLKTRILQFDDEMAGVIRKEMDAGDLAFRIRLVDGDGDDIVEPVVQTINGEKYDETCAAVFCFPENYNSVHVLGLIIPRMGGEFRVDWEESRYEIEPSQPWFAPVFSEKEYMVSLGALDRDELKRIAGVKIEVGRFFDDAFVEE